MADRIFPSAEKDSLGSAKQINTIDWDVFAKNFKFAAEEADKEKNLIIGGRLGNYKYYDMDKTIVNALDVCKKELAGK